MSLLPKSREEFGQQDYWNTFFKKRGKKAFEWYGNYTELCGYLHKYIKSKDDILMVGCGNSKLSADLYDVGLRKLWNIDISHVVIRQMQDANRNDRPDLNFLQMDATAMTFEDSKFSVVLDKGTLDALMTDDSAAVLATAHKYWSEISRVLRIGGRYICVSLLQEHILNEIVNYFPQNNYMVRIIRCFEAEQKTAESTGDGTAFPVFIIVATKFKQLSEKVFEVCMSGEKIQRLQKSDDLLQSIITAQKAALVCNGLNRGSIADMNEVSLDLMRPDEDVPRFTIHVLDQKPKNENGKFAAFIVPQGRETDWLFSTPAGRKKLLVSAHHNRLAIVSMHRGQMYTSWNDVQNELSASIRNLAPYDLKDQIIPFLSLGSDVGNREIIFKGYSQLSGDYVVEEVIGQDSKIFRRLVFLNNQFVIQSEALVKQVKGKNKKMKKIIDSGYLACQHHLYMTAGVQLSSLIGVQKKGTLKMENPLEVVVVGLGGGGLCTFIHQCLKNFNITAVEIDEAMLQIATDYFGLPQNKKIKIIIQDGIVFLKEAASNAKQFSAILFDVDSKDPSLGMSCPPQNFLGDDVLEVVKQCIGGDGVFVLNLVCRDEQLRENIIINLKTFFCSLCYYKLEEDVNEIIYCCNIKLKSLLEWQKIMEKAVKDINSFAKMYKLNCDEMIDVDEFLNELKL